MRILVLLVVTVVNLPGLCQVSSSATPKPADSHKYTGVWWAAASPDARSGFINGLSDCLTWTAHKPGFNGTPEQLTPGITRYYGQHPKSKSLSVLEVWQRISKAPVLQSPQDAAAEDWKNPHWYLNASWWEQNSRDEKTGFVNGYLWCMQTQVTATTQSYSHIADFYVEKINGFVDRNPKSESKAVADILALYADKQPASPN